MISAPSIRLQLLTVVEGSKWWTLRRLDKDDNWITRLSGVLVFEFSSRPIIICPSPLSLCRCIYYIGEHRVKSPLDLAERVFLKIAQFNCLFSLAASQAKIINLMDFLFLFRFLPAEIGSRDQSSWIGGAKSGRWWEWNRSIGASLRLPVLVALCLESNWCR